MDAIIIHINHLQTLVFNREMAALNPALTDFINELSTLLPAFKEEQVQTFNEILSLLNIAISNQDYLLMADLLEYEMKPFLINMLGERNFN